MRRVLLVDYLIGRRAGHVAEYLLLMREALAPLRPDELTPYLETHPPTGRVARYRGFAAEMWRAFRRGDVVVFHTPEARDILVLSLIGAIPGTKNGHAVMMMRRGAEIFVGAYDWRARLLERLVQHLVRRRLVSLVSDSRSAAATWERLTGKPVPVIGLPVRASLVAGRDARRGSGPLGVALVGLFREEKGIDRYEAVLRIARELESDVRIFCQVAERPNTPQEREVTEAILNAYGDDADADVRAGHLSSEDYDDALLAADVVVLPYEPALYTSGTSGLLFDALSAGATILATRFRWGVDEFGDSAAVVWLHSRDDEALRAGLGEAFERARQRRVDGIPSDVRPEAFAEGWIEAIRDALRKSGSD